MSGTGQGKRGADRNLQGRSRKKKAEVNTEKKAREIQAKRQGSALNSWRSGGALQQVAREESKDETDVPELAENDMEIDEIAEEVGDVREDFDPVFLEDFSDEKFEEDPNNDGSGDGNDDSDEKFESSVMGIYLTAIRDQLQAELSRIKKSTTPEWLLPTLRLNDFWICADSPVSKKMCKNLKIKQECDYYYAILF
jgi:hypothetical protein